MANGDNSAVSQNAMAGSAMFGAGQDNQLGFAKLMQDRQLAQQDMAADERRANESMQQFQQGMDYNKQRLGFDREQHLANLAEGREERQSRLNLQESSQKFAQEMQQRAFDSSKSLKIAELQFAKANQQERERLAPELMRLRKETSDLNAKVAAQEKLGNMGKERIAAFIKQASDLRDTMNQSKTREDEIGSRASKSAISRIYEDLSTKSLSIRDRFNVGMVEGIFTGNSNEKSADPSAIGYQFIRSETGLPDGEKIDEDAVSHTAKDYVGRHIARAISEATGDNIKAGDLAAVIDEIVKSGDEAPGDQAALMMKLQQVGVSPNVIRSALLGIANSLDGTDLGPDGKLSPLSRQALLGKLQELRQQFGGERTPHALAIEGTLKLVDKMQGMMRVAAAHIPPADLDGFDSLLGYMNKALHGGGSLSRSELAGLVPTFMKGDQDEILRDAILGDVTLGDIESLGQDPFGKINRSISGYRSSSVDKDIELKNLMEMLGDLDDGSSQSIDSYLDALSRTKF